MGERGRGAGGDIGEYVQNVLKTPLNFIRRARVRHTLEVDELSGHTVTSSTHMAETDDLKKELNW